MKNLIYLFALILCVSCNQRTGEVSSETFFSESLSAPEPTLYIKLENPRLVVDKYVVDVMMMCDSLNKKLFGMNVRLFYDAADFTGIVKFKNFAPGYGTYVYGQPPVYTGNSASKIMFGTTGAARFVNGNMQLEDKTKPLPNLNTWAKIFEIEFTPVNPITTIDGFCPEIILDKMPASSFGSFMAGSDGVTALILANPGTRYETATVNERPHYFNWVSTSNVKFKYPYGNQKCN